MPANNSARVILDAKAVERAVTRMAHEIIEKHKGAERLAIIGILTRGDILAQRIKAAIDSLEKTPVLKGTLDITMYRDDIETREWHPQIKQSSVDFDVTGKEIVLVDDVLYTGRTVRAAIDQIIDFGRPQSIELAVLVDRGHRELPIRADYVGKNIPTSRDEMVDVLFKEIDAKDEVILRKATDAVD